MTTRGTTPTHIFNTDVDLSEAEVIYITYRQGSKTVLEKAKEDIEVEESKLSVRLTQKETLAFKASKVKVQIRARFNDGSAIASNIIDTTAEAILKDGEI